MIQTIERYHGAVLARLVRDRRARTINLAVHPRYPAAYVLEDEIAVYVKYSTSRLSPWTFGFKSEHRNEIANLRKELREVFVTLACGFDGVVCLGSDEYQQIGPSGSIRVARQLRQKYVVKGGSRKNLMRIGNNEFPTKVLAALS